jgi:DIS3-like exonuclease 2
MGGVSVSHEVSETNGNHSLKKGQADARCGFEKCSNGQPVPDRMHNNHKNSGFIQAVMCENDHAIVPENCDDLD